MKSSITLDRAGRVVLPSEIRQRLRLEPGTKFSVAVVADRIGLTPRTGPDPALTRKHGRWVVAAAGETWREFDPPASRRSS